MQEFSFLKKYMGTEVAISIVTKSQEQATNLADSAYNQISQAEGIFSRFNDESLLSQLNKAKTKVVPDLFIAVLKKAIELNKKTNGAFNPLIQVDRLGYVKTFDETKKQVQEINSEPYSLDVSQININDLTKTVTLDPNQKLDFGGILKGYLAEKLAQEIITKDSSCQGVIINIGGDIHTRGYEADGSPFTFYLYNPINQTETPIALINTSLVSSGTYKRQWQTIAGMRHHIIKPSDIDNPISEVVSASVIYEDGATAEAFAKYLLINGPDSTDQKLLPEGILYSLTLKNGQTIINSP